MSSLNKYQIVEWYEGTGSNERYFKATCLSKRSLDLTAGSTMADLFENIIDLRIEYYNVEYVGELITDSTGATIFVNAYYWDSNTNSRKLYSGACGASRVPSYVLRNLNNLTITDFNMGVDPEWVVSVDNAIDRIDQSINDLSSSIDTLDNTVTTLDETVKSVQVSGLVSV